MARLEQAVEGLSSQKAVKEAPANASSTFGVTVINRAGAITLAIGIIFFFKYAVDEHLIGPWSGVALGLTFGLVLLAFGEWLRLRQQPVFAQGISGCGLASLYISLYAAIGFYQLIGETAAFAALTAVSAAAFFVSVWSSSAAIAVLGVIAALLTPLLLHQKTSSLAVEFGFICAVNLTALAIAGREHWRVLASVAGALSLGTAWLLWVPAHSALFVCFAALLAALDLAAFLQIRVPVRNEIYAVGHAAVLLALLRFLATYFTQESVVSEITSLLLLSYGIAALAYGMARSSTVNRRLGLVLAGLVVLKLYTWDVWRLDRIYRITAFLALGGLLLLASWVYSRSGKRA